MKQEIEPKKKKEDLSFQVTKKGRRMCGMLNFLRIIVIPLFFLIYPFRYYGNRKVKDGACIYIGNHYRIWDIIYPAATTWEGIHFLSKKLNGYLLGKSISNDNNSLVVGCINSNFLANRAIFTFFTGFLL